MARLGMDGSFALTEETINEKVKLVSPGNYVLGRINEYGTFLIGHIGRSDENLNAKLKSWIGKTRKPFFKFRYAPSAKAAFGKQCDNYHDFCEGKGVHPERPEGSDWSCPRCKTFK
jgi:hypothetical protein